VEGEVCASQALAPRVLQPDGYIGGIAPALCVLRTREEGRGWRRFIQSYKWCVWEMDSPAKFDKTKRMHGCDDLCTHVYCAALWGF